jgi:hypothetical protein
MWPSFLFVSAWSAIVEGATQQSAGCAQMRFCSLFVTLFVGVKLQQTLVAVGRSSVRDGQW